jgi:hypothetical protein
LYDLGVGFAHATSFYLDFNSVASAWIENVELLGGATFNRKSSYMKKQTWKLTNTPGENSRPKNFADRTLKKIKIQNYL